MMRARVLQRRYVLPLVCVVLIVVWMFFFRSASNRLVIVPNRNFEMSALCTFGTNHVYFYGDNSLDPLIKRWTDTNAYRLRYY
jgi:hypothetical protein